MDSRAQPTAEVQRLTETLRTSSRNEAKIDAADALGHHGEQASGAIQLLVIASVAGDRTLREAARTALPSIDENWAKTEAARGASEHLVSVLLRPAAS